MDKLVYIKGGRYTKLLAHTLCLDMRTENVIGGVVYVTDPYYPDGCNSITLTRTSIRLSMKNGSIKTYNIE